MKKIIITIILTFVGTFLLTVLFTKGKPQTGYDRKNDRAYIKFDVVPAADYVLSKIFPKKEVTQGDVLQNVIDNGGTVFYSIQSEDGMFSKSGVMTDSTGGAVVRARECETCSEYVMSNYFADDKEKEAYNRIFKQIGREFDLHTSPVFSFELIPSPSDSTWTNPEWRSTLKWQWRDIK